MLRDTLAQKWEKIQGSLFPWLVEEIGESKESTFLEGGFVFTPWKGALLTL